MIISRLREQVQSELIIKGKEDKVRNIYFSHKTADNEECWVVMGNNGKILGFAIVDSPMGNVVNLIC